MIFETLRRYFIVLVSLLALPALLAVGAIFTGRLTILHDRDVITALEVYIVFAPFVTVLFVLPEALRERRHRRRPD